MSERRLNRSNITKRTKCNMLFLFFCLKKIDCNLVQVFLLFLLKLESIPNITRALYGIQINGHNNNDIVIGEAYCIHFFKSRLFFF